MASRFGVRRQYLPPYPTPTIMKQSFLLNTFVYLVFHIQSSVATVNNFNSLLLRNGTYSPQATQPATAGDYKIYMMVFAFEEVRSNKGAYKKKRMSPERTMQEYSVIKTKYP